MSAAHIAASAGDVSTLGSLVRALISIAGLTDSNTSEVASASPTGDLNAFMDDATMIPKHAQNCLQQAFVRTLNHWNQSALDIMQKKHRGNVGLHRLFAAVRRLMMAVGPTAAHRIIAPNSSAHSSELAPGWDVRSTTFDWGPLQTWSPHPGERLWFAL